MYYSFILDFYYLNLDTIVKLSIKIWIGNSNYKKLKEEIKKVISFK